MKNTITKVFDKEGRQIYEKSTINGKTYKFTNLFDDDHNTSQYNDSNGFSKFIEYDKNKIEVSNIKEKFGKVISTEIIDGYDNFGHTIKGRLFSENLERTTSYIDCDDGSRIVFVSSCNYGINNLNVNVYSETGKTLKSLHFADNLNSNLLKDIYNDIDSVPCQYSTIWEYDNQDRLIHMKSTMPTDFEEWYEYNENGFKTHYIDDYSESWTECDINGNEIHFINMCGDEEFKEYNDKNELIRESTNDQVTIYEPFSDEELKLFKDSDIDISIISDTRYRIYDKDKNLVSYCSITYNADSRTFTIEHFSMPDEKIISEYVYAPTGKIKSESLNNGDTFIFYLYNDNIEIETVITTLKDNTKAITRKKTTNLTDIDIVEIEFDSDC